MQSRYDSFSHSYLTNEELRTLAIRVCTELETSHPSDEYLSTECALVKEESSTITTLKGRSKSGAFTEEIENTDKKRDRLIRVINRKLINDIDLAEYDPEQAERAEKVFKIMKDNKVDLKAGNSEETAMINSLLEVAGKPGNLEVVQASSVASQFEALKTVQDEFEDLIQQQAKANSEVPVGVVKEHIGIIIFHLEGILSYLERKAMSDSATYEASAAKIEEMIVAVMTPARARASKKEVELELAE